MKKLLVVLLCLGLIGCASVFQPIQKYRVFEQPLTQPLTASIGSILVRMNRQADLPNAYGGKDIYFGKVDRGFVEIKLVGISQASELTLEVSDINRQSTETTMDRYVVRPDVSVAQTVNLITSGQSGVVVKIDTRKDKEYIVGGVKVIFLEIKDSSVVYRVDDLMPIPK